MRDDALQRRWYSTLISGTLRRGTSTVGSEHVCCGVLSLYSVRSPSDHMTYGDPGQPYFPAVPVQAPGMQLMEPRSLHTIPSHG